MNLAQMSASESVFLFNPGSTDRSPGEALMVGTRLLAMGVAASQMVAEVRECQRAASAYLDEQDCAGGASARHPLLTQAASR